MYSITSSIVKHEFFTISSRNYLSMRKFLLSLIEQFGYKVTKFDRKAAGPYADIQDKTF